MSELSKKQTAVFAHADEMPSGLSNSLELLAPTEKKICSLLVNQKPGPELQRTLLYFLNLLKHLVSGYLKSDKGEKLSELVKLTKDWASKVILGMQAMEQETFVDEKEQRRALEVSGVCFCVWLFFFFKKKKGSSRVCGWHCRFVMHSLQKANQWFVHHC